MSNNLENIDPIDLITRSLAGEISQEEEQQLSQWLAADPANREEYERFKKSWEGLEKAKDLVNLDMKAEWQRLESAIDSSGQQESKVISMQEARAKNKWQPFLRIAAAILVLLVPASIVYILFFGTAPNRIVAESTVVEQKLPDGSLVALNRHSLLTYPDDFNKEVRRVKLSGEAFFEVEHNPTKPFIIDAGAISVKVLGTSFNVNATDISDIIEVVVKTGKVQMYTNTSPPEEIVLRKGDKGIYSKKSRSLIKEENRDINYLSWKTRRLSFKNQKLEKVVKKLIQVYDSNVIITSDEIKKCRISVSFDKQPLDEVLHVLKTLLNIEVVQKDKSIELSGKGC